MHLTATAASTAADIDLSGVRRRLEQQRRFRAEQIEELISQLNGAAAAAPHLQVTLALKAAAEHVLREVDAALRRLDDGTYGTCGNCHEPIPPERLQVIATSRYCLPCQFRAEPDAIVPAGTRTIRRPPARPILRHGRPQPETGSSGY